MNGKDELGVPQSAAVQGPVAMYYTSVSCQLSGGDQRQLTACNTSYHQPSALSTRTQLMVQAIARDTQKLDISLFLVLGRKCDEDRDTKQRVTRCEHRSLVSVSPRYYLTPPLHVSV